MRVTNGWNEGMEQDVGKKKREKGKAERKENDIKRGMRVECEWSTGRNVGMREEGNGKGREEEEGGEMEEDKNQ